MIAPLPDGAVALHPTTVAVLNAVDALIHEKGRATIREIGAAVGLSAASGVQRHLTRLRGLGLVDWEPGCAGTIHLTVQRVDRPAACCASG